MTSIEWVKGADGAQGKTWNPIVGCSKISEGCRNCYTINQAYRNAAMGAKLENPGRLAYYDGLTEKRNDRLEWTGKVNFVPEALEIPLKTRKPTTFLTNSMSDLFHESVTDEQLDQIFAVMALTPNHTYQVLTKRPERMLEYFQRKYILEHWAANANWLRAGRSHLNPPKYKLPLPNVMLGVTVENQKTADARIPLLLQTPAAVRFLSCEPLLESIEIDSIKYWHDWGNGNREYFANWNPLKPLDGDGISWVIAGGESGHGARPCDIEWIRSIVQQCQDANVPVFVKQLGSKSNYPCLGKGNLIAEFPEDLQIREMPRVKGETIS